MDSYSIRDGWNKLVESPISEDGDWDAALQDAGFSKFWKFGGEESSGSDTVTVYKRLGYPPYLVDVSSMWASDQFACWDMPSLLDAFAKYLGPFVTAASLGSIREELERMRELMEDSNA